MKFSFVIRNNNLNQKLHSTHQDEFEDVLISKMDPQKYIHHDGTQNGANKLTLKHELSNCSSFGKSENANEFLVAKRIWEGGLSF